MHPNPEFRALSAQQCLAIAKNRGFGILALNGDGAGPLLSHLPFHLSADGTYAELHLVRSNPIARLGDGPWPAALAVSGPDGYISPDWYGLEDQVPTWNYVAVHLRGELTARPESELPAMLARLSKHFEGALAPKLPWRMDKLSTAQADRLMRIIRPFRLAIQSIEGTCKLNQNKPEKARLGAAKGVAAGTPGHETAALAEMMRIPPA